MLLFCKKNNVEVSAYSVLTPTFIIEPFLFMFCCVYKALFVRAFFFREKRDFSILMV